MYNKTVIDVIFDTKNEIVSVCCERAYELLATVLFMVLIPWGRKFWLNVMNFAIFLEGIVCIVVPEKFMARLIVSIENCIERVYKLQRAFATL